MSEQYGNPYRWVVVRSNPQYGAPTYHHRISGLSGKLKCRLTALTPLFVGGNKKNGEVFLLKTVDGRDTPFIPGTSLKGRFRSLVEILADSPAPFKSPEKGLKKRLDSASRIFGTLHGADGADGTVYSGSVQCSDAKYVGLLSFNQWTSYKVVVGKPKPEHTAFYPTNRDRKFYLHKHGATTLQTTQLNQSRTVRPAPPDSAFEFDVEYTSLSPADLSLLIYSIVLEKHVVVSIGSKASGLQLENSIQLAGPMRHKIGGCKGVNGGSSHIEITQWDRYPSFVDRYRHGQRKADSPTELQAVIDEIIAPLVARIDDTMLDLRAATIYCDGDPRTKSLRYPSKDWFNENSKTAIPPIR